MIGYDQHHAVCRRHAMHLKTDRKIFRRLFILGVVGAFLLFTIVLLTLSGLPNT